MIASSKRGLPGRGAHSRNVSVIGARRLTAWSHATPGKRASRLCVRGTDVCLLAIDFLAEAIVEFAFAQLYRQTWEGLMAKARKKAAKKKSPPKRSNAAVKKSLADVRQAQKNLELKIKKHHAAVSAMFFFP
jgi:hypothetical protein